jgi:hypothetical protein
VRAAGSPTAAAVATAGETGANRALGKLGAAGTHNAHSLA